MLPCQMLEPFRFARDARGNASGFERFVLSGGWALRKRNTNK